MWAHSWKESVCGTSEFRAFGEKVVLISTMITWMWNGWRTDPYTHGLAHMTGSGNRPWKHTINTLVSAPLVMNQCWFPHLRLRLTGCTCLMRSKCRTS